MLLFRPNYVTSGLRGTFSTGQMAPSFTQAVRSVICASVRWPFLGILISVVWRMAVIIMLFSGAPGTTAGPDFPPFSSPSSESRRNPPHLRIGVAGKAILSQYRPNAVLKKVFLLLRRRGRLR